MCIRDSFGITPSEPQVLDLLKWLRQAGNDEFFVSSRLSSHYPEAEDYASKASGVVVVGVSKLRSTYVLWFRQEQVQTVRWAGDPAKTAQTSLGAVHPRHSFSQWTEIVRGSSVPWLDEQIEAAHEFRGAILEIVLGRAEELAEMAAGLQLANTELEAFSYSISHDLRAPFRHISGFSRLLREAEGERMGEQGRHYLEVIESSARFAGQLVDGLLDFSRLARTVPVMVPVDLARLADSEWQAVLAGEAQGDAHRRVEFSRTPLPTVVGDPQLLRQVLRNLFSNAVKYTARQPAPFIRVEATERDGEYIVSIRDNGVGFDQQYAGKLFGVFQRLHRIEEFEGTGIGLANVRRIVGRHGGRAWAEGEVGKGATFFFSLPIAPNGEQGTDERFEAHFDRRG